MLIQGTVGAQTNSDGSIPSAGARMGKQGDILVSGLHGDFYEQTYRGNVFSGGMTVTSINSVTFTSATLGATCTPIVGLWNPSTSIVNLVILQVILGTVITALQNTGGAPFVWATSTGNAAISTGNAPFNRKTWAASGSGAKDLSGLALTGLTNSLVVRNVADVGGGNLYNIATLSTAAGFSTTYIPSIQDVRGVLQVPPGGVLALLATTTPVAHSSASGIIWEEVPVA